MFVDPQNSLQTGQGSLVAPGSLAPGSLARPPHSSYIPLFLQPSHSTCNPLGEKIKNSTQRGSRIFSWFLSTMRHRRQFGK